MVSRNDEKKDTQRGSNQEKMTMQQQKASGDQDPINKKKRGKEGSEKKNNKR